MFVGAWIYLVPHWSAVNWSVVPQISPRARFTFFFRQSKLYSIWSYRKTSMLRRACSGVCSDINIYSRRIRDTNTTTQRGISCVRLTRLHRGEVIHWRIFSCNLRSIVRKFGSVIAESELFTLRDAHSFWRASLLPLVSSQALVGRNFGPAAVANLEAHVWCGDYLKKSTVC